MPYAPRTAGPCSDLARSLMVCPNCLGDLVPSGGLLADDLVCSQCRQTVSDSNRRMPAPVPLVARLVVPELLLLKAPIPIRVARTA